jgi:hypothetical protein
MIKKVLISIVLINTIFFYIFLKVLMSNNQTEFTTNFEKNIVDIKKSNEIIDTYSNYVNEIIPANE